MEKENEYDYSNTMLQDKLDTNIDNEILALMAYDGRQLNMNSSFAILFDKYLQNQMFKICSEKRLSQKISTIQRVHYTIYFYMFALNCIL
jgi:hypothetical protein